MPEYERTVSLEVGVDEAYGYLSDPQNLSSYIAAMIDARSASGDRLHVAAAVNGRHEEGEASFRKDAQAHRMEWGSPANPHYHGSLEVRPSGAASVVTIHIRTDHPEEANEAERVMDETVANIKNRLVRR